jgi:predicted RNA-binding protein
MCLSKLYAVEGDESKPLLENITSIHKENGQLKFKTLFGEEEIYEGELISIDFNESKVFIKRNNK